MFPGVPTLLGRVEKDNLAGLTLSFQRFSAFHWEAGNITHLLPIPLMLKRDRRTPTLGKSAWFDIMEHTNKVLYPVDHSTILAVQTPSFRLKFS